MCVGSLGGRATLRTAPVTPADFPGALPTPATTARGTTQPAGCGGRGAGEAPGSHRPFGGRHDGEARPPPAPVLAPPARRRPAPLRQADTLGPGAAADGPGAPAARPPGRPAAA